MAPYVLWKEEIGEKALPRNQEDIENYILHVMKEVEPETPGVISEFTIYTSLKTEIFLKNFLASAAHFKLHKFELVSYVR